MDEWRNRSGFTVELIENDAKSRSTESAPEIAASA